MELISVVVPVYKVEKYLCQCLDSVRAQTYRNLEVIMVDDGSPDNCGVICEKYAEKYSNFKVVHKKNMGLGMARNTGLEYVTGEYVMFLDSDDYIDADLIEKLYEQITIHNVDVCRSGSRSVNDSGEITSKDSFPDEVFLGKAAATEFLPRLIGSAPDKKDGLGRAVWATLYKTSHIIRNNITFPSERDLISEDIIFNVAYMQYADGACVISDIGYNYRVNNDSLTRKYRPDRFKDIIKFHVFLKQSLMDLDYPMSVLYRADRTLYVNVKGCIRQEKKKISAHAAGTALKNIRKMCGERVLQESIRNYPVKQLGFRQKIFLYMIKYRMAFLLYACSNLNLL